MSSANKNPEAIQILVSMLTAGLHALNLDPSKEVLQIMLCDKEPAADGTPNAIILASCPQEAIPELLTRALTTIKRTEEGGPGNGSAGQYQLNTQTGEVTEIPPGQVEPTDEVKAYVDTLFDKVPRGPTH